MACLQQSSEHQAFPSYRAAIARVCLRHLSEVAGSAPPGKWGKWGQRTFLPPLPTQHPHLHRVVGTAGVEGEEAVAAGVGEVVFDGCGGETGDEFAVAFVDVRTGR